MGSPKENSGFRRGERDLKKGNALLRKGPALVYVFIYKHRFQLRVAKMCTVLHVSRSGYYEWIERKESQRSQRRKGLETQIRRAFLEPRCLYGNPKITQVLRQKGVQVSEKTVARLMKEMELKSCTIKEYKATTNSKHNLPVRDNLLAQKFSVQAPNQVWMAVSSEYHGSVHPKNCRLAHG